MKIDIEGHEPEALQGLYECLPAMRDDLEIVLELTGAVELRNRGIDQVEILIRLARQGFRAYAVDNSYSSTAYVLGTHSNIAMRIPDTIDTTCDLVLSRVDPGELIL